MILKLQVLRGYSAVSHNCFNLIINSHYQVFPSYVAEIGFHSFMTNIY